jgi:hypothetical protein
LFQIQYLDIFKRVFKLPDLGWEANPRSFYFLVTHHSSAEPQWLPKKLFSMSRLLAVFDPHTYVYSLHTHIHYCWIGRKLWSNRFKTKFPLAGEKCIQLAFYFPKNILTAFQKIPCGKFFFWQKVHPCLQGISRKCRMWLFWQNEKKAENFFSGKIILIFSHINNLFQIIWVSIT